MPIRWQQELKRIHMHRQMSRDQFTTNEPEFAFLGEWVASGDWVLDIGANIGHYTMRLSNLVGPTGRVIAFEPVPETFELVASNAARALHRNVTLLNVAASDSMSIANMSLPTFDTGLDNYYMAGITAGEGRTAVITIPVDHLQISHTISFVKIDVEGHELQTILGMIGLLKRDHPKLVVEGFSADVNKVLTEIGYSFFDLPGSSNRVFTAIASADPAAVVTGARVGR